MGTSRTSRRVSPGTAKGPVRSRPPRAPGGERSRVLRTRSTGRTRQRHPEETPGDRNGLLRRAHRQSFSSTWRWARRISMNSSKSSSVQVWRDRSASSRSARSTASARSRRTVAFRLSPRAALRIRRRRAKSGGTRRTVSRVEISATGIYLAQSGVPALSPGPGQRLQRRQKRNREWSETRERGTGAAGPGARSGPRARTRWPGGLPGDGQAGGFRPRVTSIGPSVQTHSTSKPAARRASRSASRGK